MSGMLLDSLSNGPVYVPKIRVGDFLVRVSASTNNLFDVHGAWEVVSLDIEAAGIKKSPNESAVSMGLEGLKKEVRQGSIIILRRPVDPRLSLLDIQY